MKRTGFGGWLLLAAASAACGDRPAPPGGAARAPAPPAATADGNADTLSLAERRAAGGRIVFVSERGGVPRAFVVAPTGEGAREVAAGGGASYPAAVSPDGRTLLAIAVREQGGEHGEQMVLAPMGGGAARPLGPAGPRARSAAWSPDGSWVVFESDRASFRDLYRIGPDGSGLRRLTENREGNFDPAVSPDGRWIAFASSRDGDAEIYVMRADGGGERRLTAFHRDDWGPRWSPDGRTIAFLSNREGADRVFLVSPDGTGVRKLGAGTGTDSAAAPWQEADPAWSPDGTRIALTRHVRPGESHVRIVDVRTGGAREVGGAAAASQPAWSPDGRHLAFTAGSGADAELWIARADGSRATRITRSQGADWLPRWVR
ncbi:MAG: TolB family protein [Longimicrobiaceae bacterium]